MNRKKVAALLAGCTTVTMLTACDNFNPALESEMELYAPAVLIEEEISLEQTEPAETIESEETTTETLEETVSEVETIENKEETSVEVETTIEEKIKEQTELDGFKPEIDATMMYAMYGPSIMN